MTRVIRQNSIYRSHYQYKSTSAAQAKHKVSLNSLRGKLPKVRLDAATNSIFAYTDDPSLTEVVSIKEKINIKVDENGKITKPIVGPINLGCQYDQYVTVLHFDLSRLLWRTSDLSNYIFRIAFFDEASMAKKVYYQVKQGERVAFDVETNHLTFEFDGEDFFVPREITSNPVDYKMILIIQEKVKDETTGNIEPGVERFISDIWDGYVSPSFYRPNFPLDALEMDNHEVALSKRAISMILADDGTLAVSDLSLGNMYDSFIKVFDFKKVSAHVTSLSNTFMLFEQDGDVYASRFHADMDSWVPAEITAHPGAWRVMVVAYEGDLADPDYFYCSTPIEMTVEGNFLEEAAFNTDTGSSKKDDIETGRYSNFVTEDHQLIQTKDGMTFYWNEG